MILLQKSKVILSISIREKNTYEACRKRTMILLRHTDMVRADLVFTFQGHRISGDLRSPSFHFTADMAERWLESLQ